MITGPVDTVKRARKLRSEMTLPEGLLWRELRKRPGGFKFRRQHPAGVYVLDFYCAAVRLDIEVDGAAHASLETVQSDQVRSHFIRSQHIATTRIPAATVLSDVAAVIARIVEICEARAATMSGLRPVPLHHPAGGPPPPVGEEW